MVKQTQSHKTITSTRPHLNLTHLMLIFFSIAFPWMLKLITINYLFSLKNLLSRFLLPEPPYSSSLILSSPPRGGAFLAAQVSPLSLSLSVNLCGRICRVIFAVFSLVAGKYFSFLEKDKLFLTGFSVLFIFNIYFLGLFGISQILFILIWVSSSQAFVGAIDNRKWILVDICERAPWVAARRGGWWWETLWFVPSLVVWACQILPFMINSDP